MTAPIEPVQTRYETLAAPEQRAYQLLPLIPGPYLTPAAAGAALRTGPAATDRLLDALHRAALLDRLPGGEPEFRWRMPDDVAEHAASLPDPDGPDPDGPGGPLAVLARVVWSRLVRAARLDRVIAPGRRRYAPAFGAEADPRADVDSDIGAGDEWRAVRRVQQILQELLADQAAAAAAGLHHLAWQTADVLWGFLRLTKPFAEWDRVCTIALDSAGRCGDPGALARIHLLAGLRARRAGDLDGALDHHQAAVRAARRAGDGLTEAAAAEHHGATLIEMGEHEQALRVLKAGLELYRVLPPHQRGKALLQRQLGIAHSLADQHDQADQHFAAAEQTFTGLGEPYLLSRLSTNRAETALRVGAPDRALAHLNRAAEHLPHRSTSDMAYLEALRATAEADAGDPDAARQTLDRARHLCEDLPEGHPTIVLVRRLSDQLGPR
ncbi:tetratricopeptide repeat protein [Actinomadura litoris]|uniref:tetratricopeptide repeat protein n=1 Tax=Actinomadura litoris TaxID=2678616 RepID=UPI001FA78151|nr:tetratricopeptide repeat protein [Actinomadura litoris]